MAKVTLDEWTTKTEARMRAVIQQATDNLVAEAQTSRSHGGNMPVVTSFLKNSLVADPDSMPSGTSSKGNATAVALQIKRMEIGDSLYIGWVAQYARAMEWKYGFMRLAAQNWQQHVNNAVKKVRG